MTRITCVLALLAGLLNPAYAGGIAAAEPIVSSRTAGSGVGTVIWESTPRSDGYYHADTPAMLEKIKGLGVNHYTYSMWQSKKDWDDFRLEFMPRAQQLGLAVWVYLVPPSECQIYDATGKLKPVHQQGRCSWLRPEMPARPHWFEHYRDWAEAIAQLSLQYPKLTGWAIDDFLVSGTDRLTFSRTNLQAIRAAERAINPNLEMYAVLYHGHVLDPAALDQIEGLVDGVIYPYTGHGTDTLDPALLEQRLDQVLAKLNPRGLKLMLLIYATRYYASVAHPQEDYLADLLRRARPYLQDGRLSGVTSYGTPNRHELHQPSRDYWARTGTGRLSFLVSTGTQTAAGDYAEAAQTISLDPAVATKKLVFAHRDQYEAKLRATGYQWLQVLVDGVKVWDRDLATDVRDVWKSTTLDLSGPLAGKASARLAFRLYHRAGVGDYPIDVGIDDVTATGFTLADGGFEQKPGPWTLSRKGPVLPLVDHFAIDRPIAIYNAIGTGFAAILGTTFTPVPRQTFPQVRLSPANRAMYGNGRFEVTLPDNPRVAVPAGSTRCGLATQRMTVRPSARYELSFWSADSTYHKWNDKLYKMLFIQNGTGSHQVQMLDVNDDSWWYYRNGWSQQGPIDVTAFVQGNSEVTVKIGVCAKTSINPGTAITEFPEGIEVVFDNVETIGLDVRDGGFETSGNWSTVTAESFTAGIVIR